jgi:hypothetical protein
MKVIGEYLREMVTGLKEADIVRALHEQCLRTDRGEHKPLGEILLEWGLITEEELKAALARQEREGPRLFIPRDHHGSESAYG